MSGLDWYWAIIDRQRGRLRVARTAGDVLRILGGKDNASSGDGFYGGDGEDMWEALRAAGWSDVWSEAGYHWAMRAPDGSVVTYCEGDVYAGDRKPLPHGEPS